MSILYFTSDPHIGHRWVAGLRGFASPEEHDEWYCDTWSSQVNKRDQVWVLGDLSIGGMPYMLETMAKLPGSKNLVFGNHDPGHPMFREAPRMQKKYLEVFRSVQSVARLKTFGQSVLLSHFPYSGDGSDHTEVERYTQWRLPDLGEWLLHGHTHLADQRLHDGRQIHVGWDAWRRLVSGEEIAEIIEGAEHD